MRFSYWAVSAMLATLLHTEALGIEVQGSSDLSATIKGQSADLMAAEVAAGSKEKGGSKKDPKKKKTPPAKKDDKKKRRERNEELEGEVQQELASE